MNTISPADKTLQGAPAMFVENVGEFDSATHFQVNGAGGVINFAPDALQVTLLEPLPQPDLTNGRPPDPFAIRHLEAETPRSVVNLRLSFTGANPNPKIVGIDPLATRVAYFIGNDPTKWRTDVPVYGGVRYVDLYPGFDLEITADGGQWAWRLVPRGVAARPQISLRIEGADAIRLESNRLRVTTSVGEFT
ncbi:MAG: hypothetical protein AAB658_08720, partial [Chloroflexota bacterium]